MITFHNATDADGHIIHIDEVTRENRVEHYYCVGCGEEMSAVLGDKREQFHSVMTLGTEFLHFSKLTHFIKFLNVSTYISIRQFGL